MAIATNIGPEVFGQRHSLLYTTTMDLKKNLQDVIGNVNFKL